MSIMNKYTRKLKKKLDKKKIKLEEIDVMELKKNKKQSKINNRYEN